MLSLLTPKTQSPQVGPQFGKGVQDAVVQPVYGHEHPAPGVHRQQQRLRRTLRPPPVCQVERTASADCSRPEPDTDTRGSAADTAGTGCRTATATRLHNLNIDLKRNAFKVPMLIVLTTIVQGDIFFRAFSRTANQGRIRRGPDGVCPSPLRVVGPAGRRPVGPQNRLCPAGRSKSPVPLRTKNRF